MSVYIPLPASEKPAPPTVIRKEDDGVTYYARLVGIMGGSLQFSVLFGVLWAWGTRGLAWYQSAFVWFFGLSCFVWVVAGIGAFGFYVYFKVYRPTYLEDEDRKTRKPKVEVVYQTLDFPAVENFKYAGYKIISGYFFEYPTLTREQAETERLCSQTEWNVFNTIAKHHQIRTPGNLWNKAKDEEALYLWHVTSFEMPEREPGTLVAHLAGGTTLKFDLTKKGILKK
jgi:hypothetical protein